MTSIELHCRLKVSLQPIVRNDADIVYLEEQVFQLQRGSFALFTDGIALQRPLPFTSVAVEIRVSLFCIYRSLSFTSLAFCIK